ncbi:hypothetical protein RHGRI_025593 [Rhododendron griersonianum]|uniref:N-acetyltransferase domain-containing protein n=1 Tax=Rhododendron griersonianum TaxID=479676 RepID=A0AAV6IPV6_9ERIC|nr:hypothetical protein RHGRI_025593 [Rhododendron griersonianum]
MEAPQLHRRRPPMQPFAKIVSPRRHPSQPTTPNPPMAKKNPAHWVLGTHCLFTILATSSTGFVHRHGEGGSNHRLCCSFLFFRKKCGEVAAIAVSPECRGQGQGDKLLDLVVKKESSIGFEMLFLRTTRTADWFVRRGFSACSVECIPEEKRKKIYRSCGSKY